MNDRLSARHALQNQDTFDANDASSSNDCNPRRGHFAKTLENSKPVVWFDDCHYLRIRPTHASSIRRRTLPPIQLSKSRILVSRRALSPAVRHAANAEQPTVGPTGLEPSKYTDNADPVKGPGRTFCQNPAFSRRPLEPSGLEPPTSWLQTRRSPD